MKEPIVLYDSTCRFCKKWVDILSKADKRNRLNFLPLNSPDGVELVTKYRLENVNSVILINRSKIYIKSEAILQALKRTNLSMAGRIASFFPKAFRDRIYDFIARNRYRLFGRNEIECDCGK